MKRQPKARITELIENFPTLGLTRYEWRWKKNNRWRNPKMNIHVQLADPETMHLQAKNCDYLGRSYVIGKNDDRGTRFEYLIAINHDDMEIARLLWERGELEKMSKDIFQIASPEQVSYLVWVSVTTWYKPASEEREAETDGILFSTEKTGVELHIIVFRKPKNLSFEELIKTADRQKKEREEAYKYPPKKMPEFAKIHQALKDGCRIHAFLSGGGLRVVRLENNDGSKSYYGEHPHIEDALEILEEDVLAGGRPYNKVYGKMHPHYLTGSTLPTSNIDSWLRRGSTFDCWQKNGRVVFELRGYAQTETPKEVEERLKEMEEGEVVLWSNRGYVYATGKDRFPNGDPCTSTKIVESPPGKDNADPWMYHITKIGQGENLWVAMKEAFEAPEVEVQKN